MMVYCPIPPGPTDSTTRNSGSLTIDVFAEGAVEGRMRKAVAIATRAPMLRVSND